MKVPRALVHHFVKPTPESQLPGRLRLRFAHYALLPRAAQPYLTYIEPLVRLHPLVRSCRFNPRIGTMLLCYDQDQATAEDMLSWLRQITDACITVAENVQDPLPSDQILFELVQARLTAELSGRTAC